MTLKKAIAQAIAFICLMMFLLLFEFWIIGVVQVNRASYLAPQSVKDAHKKHGIGVPMEYRGKFYFERNGKRCPL